MKNTDKQKLRQSSEAELIKKLADLQQQVVVTKAEIKLGKTKNTKTASNQRNQIAFIKTILHEKHLTKDQGK